MTPRRSWHTALTLTRLDTRGLEVLGGVTVGRVVHGLNRTSAKKIRVSSDKVKQDRIIEGTDLYSSTV